MKLQTKKKSRSFNFVLSDVDYKNLHTLANDLNMKPSEYLRTLIQVTWLANNSDKVLKNGSLEIGGYGITFPTEFLETFTNKLETAFSELDWNDLEDKITITGQRHYRPK